MAEINKLSLKAFYENNKEKYYGRRQSGEKELWDEQYKWDILTKLNERLSKYQNITSGNLSEVLQELKKNNPNKGSFAHWIDMDDLNILAEKPNGWQVINAIWQATPDSVDDAIDSANMMSDLLTMGSKKFSPSTYGFILAARNCDKFSVYRDIITKQIADICSIKMPVKQGEKYKLLNDSALYLGELMQADNLVDGLEHKALNGQDFLWVVLAYDNL